MSLKALIDSEALNAGRTDQEVYDWLHELVNKNRSSLSGDEMFQATDSTDWAALTADEKSQWLALCGRDSIDPFGPANVALVTAIFSGGSTTVSNLTTLRVEQVTRYANAGIRKVIMADITRARQ